MLDKLKALIEDRLRKKLKRAESAYIKAKTTKETLNCRHKGPQLSERIHICKIGCCGVDGNSAGQCWNQKAQACEEFQLIRSPEVIRREFRGMDDEEIAVRWPQIGELLWTLRRITELQRASGELRDTPSE